MRRRPELASELLGRGREFAVLAAELAPPLADEESPDDLVERGIGHLEHLAVALSTGRPALFEHHVEWASRLRIDGSSTLDSLRWHLDALAGIVVEHARADAATVPAVVARTLALIPDRDDGPSSFVDTSAPLGELAGAFLHDLLRGDHRTASHRVLEAARDGIPIEDLYLDVFQTCLREVGRLWQLGLITVAQEHVVTAATQLVMAQLYPFTFASPRIGRSVLVASVGGELHEVGARMVADIFELRGWESRFVGANTPTDSMAALVADASIDVVAISVSAPRNLPTAEAAVAAVRAAGASKVLVGGPAFNQVADLWEVVGADGTAPDAVGAVAEALRLMEAEP